MLKTYSILLDYPPRERMYRRDSRVLISMGKRKASLSYTRDSIKIEAYAQ